MGFYSPSGLFLRLRQRGQKVEPVEARIFVTCSLVVGELLGAGQERLLRDIVPGQANVEGWYGSAYGNGSVATVRPLDWRRGAGWNRRGELDVAAGAPRNTKAVMHVCVLTTARGGSGFQAQLPYDLRRRCSRSSTTCSGNFGISAARAGALQPAHRFHGAPGSTMADTARIRCSQVAGEPVNLGERVRIARHCDNGEREHCCELIVEPTARARIRNLPEYGQQPVGCVPDHPPTGVPARCLICEDTAAGTQPP